MRKTDHIPLAEIELVTYEIFEKVQVICLSLSLSLTHTHTHPRIVRALSRSLDRSLTPPSSFRPFFWKCCLHEDLFHVPR